MLENIRGLAKTPVAKALLIVLVGSFGVWGVKGLVAPARDTAVAHVGKLRVTPEEFQRVFDRQLEAGRRQFGDSFDTAQARAYGLDTRILEGLVTGAALDEAARRMGLTAPDDAIIKATREQKAFFGPDGRFSKSQFLEVLRRSGYNETTFTEAVRRDLTRAQLQDMLTGGIVAPAAMAEPLYRFHAETRLVRYIVVTPDALGTLPEPSDDELKAYYDAHKADYRTPEYRKFSFVLLDPSAIAKTLTVDETKAREYFEFHKDEYGKAETRSIEQIVYPDEASAVAARDAITAGTSFEDSAQAAGFSPDDIKLGAKSAKELPKAVADAAFALPEGKVSQPVKTDFGYALLRVTAITEGHEATFDEARPAIEAQIAKDDAAEKAYDIGNTLEDKRQSGASLEDAAKELGLEVHVIDAADAQGHAPDGTPIALLDGQSELLTQAFKATAGEESDLVPTATGGYVAFRVDSVTPPADKDFDAVKSEVRDQLEAQNRGKALDDKAAALMTEAKAGTSLDDLASGLGRIVQTSDPIQRGSSNETFSKDAVDAIFATAKDGFALGKVAIGQSRLVMQVTEVSEPDAEMMTKALPEVRKDLAQLLDEEVLETYAAYAKVVANVRYNEDVLARVLGRDTEAQTP